jgi:hypothetical protein
MEITVWIIYYQIHQKEFLDYFNRALKGERINVENHDSNYWQNKLLPVYDNCCNHYGIAHNVLKH